jgi:hypothetical protein
MPTMTNLHHLWPCALCSVRMAVPRRPICTMCDAVTLPAMVPDDITTLALSAPPRTGGFPTRQTGDWPVRPGLHDG